MTNSSDEWKVAHIQPKTACGVEDLLNCKEDATPGNITVCKDTQYNLTLRRGDISMAEFERNVCRHPGVKQSTVKWSNTKLMNGRPMSDHESAWNVQFQTTASGHKVTAGYTRHGRGADDAGKQITHAWFKFSPKMNNEARNILCDLLLNVCGYFSWFSYGQVRRTVWQPVAPNASSPAKTYGLPAASSSSSPAQISELPVAPYSSSPEQISELPVAPSSSRPAPISEQPVAPSSSKQPLASDAATELRQIAHVTQASDSKITWVRDLCETNRQRHELKAELAPQSDNEVKTGAASIAHEQLQPTQVTEQPVALQSQLEATPLVIEESVALQPLSVQEAVAHLPRLRHDEALQLQTQPCAQGAGMQDAEDLEAKHYYQQSYIPGLQLEQIRTEGWVDMLRSGNNRWCDASHEFAWGRCDTVDPSWVHVPSAMQPEVEQPSRQGHWDAENPSWAHMPKAMQPEVEQPSRQGSGCDPMNRCEQDPMSIPTDEPEPVSRKWSGPQTDQWKKRKPTQVKFAEPHDPMKTPFRFGQLPDLQSDDLKLKAEATAEIAEFPFAALSQEPKGYYAWKWEETMYEFGRKRPDVPVTSRDFVSRTGNDGVILMCVLSQYLSFKQPVALGCEIFGPPWSDALEECFRKKPDLRFFGFVPIPDGEFQTKFKGKNSLFLKHMCEKHHGESIAVYRKIREEIENPRNANMHHPQFFVHAHKYQEALADMSRAAQYFHPKKRGRAWRSAGGTCEGGANEGKDEREAFVTEQSKKGNSVYIPGSSESKCHKVVVAYHTLPSLIYQCCQVADLMDIYTYFCTQEL